MLMAGQTFAAPGEPHARQRLFERLAGTVYRSDSDDWAPPRIESVEGFVVADGRLWSATLTGKVGSVAPGVVVERLLRAVTGQQDRTSA